MIRTHMWIRLLIAAVSGLVISVFILRSTGHGALFTGLVAYVIAGMIFTLPLLWFFITADAERSPSHFENIDPSRWESDALVIASSITSLGAVGFLLVASSGRTAGQQSIDAGLGLAAVATSWLLLHSVYTLRYAKHYFLVDPRSIDFNADTPPRMSDFAYFAFNLGMTYQVSDTAARTSALRRIIWGHCTLSWIFGTVIIATAMNLVVGLAG